MMDWSLSTDKKRASRKKGPSNLGKSSSEPNLTDHYTPRFPNNLTKLLHEYVTVDGLQFYRKRRPPNAENEVHSNFCLYDRNVTPLPFSAMKTEYTREFGKTCVRSRSVPKKIGILNKTTNELIDALRDDDTDVITMPEKSVNRVRPLTAKISGDIELKADVDVLASIMKPYAQVRQPIDGDAPHIQPNVTDPNALNMKSCTLKLEGELTYVPEYQSQYRQHQSIERSQSIPQMNNIKFYGNFHGIPEYQEKYKLYENIAKREPLKRSDHLKLSPRINAAIVSPLDTFHTSEYADQFKESSGDNATKSGTPAMKSLDNSSIKKHLTSTYQTQSMPEYQDKFKDPDVRKMPTLAKAREHNLSLDGNMEYKPEYRANYIDYPRARPTTKRPETHMHLFEMPSSPGSVGSPPPPRAPILTNKYATKVAVIEPSKNIHHPTGIDVDPSYLCQPEVRKARRELLLRKRPPSPSKTLAAAIKSSGKGVHTNEEEENKIYNAKSHIVTADTKPIPITVTVENFDDPKDKALTILTVNSPPKYGRRASVINNKSPPKGNAQRQRNRAKIIEGNRDYFTTNLPKKNSLSSTTTTTMTDDEPSATAGNGKKGFRDGNAPTSKSFIILNEPCNENKWMKSSLLY